MKNANMSKGIAMSPRQKYVHDTLELKFDLFANATAELELQINSERPPFFSCFVSPPYDPGGVLLLEKLKEPELSCVYGDPGSGKTTLRYAFEAMCRTMPDRTLVVSHTMGRSAPQPSSPSAIWQSLSQSLATDLFIQLLEQYHVLDDAPRQPLVDALRGYWYDTIPHFNRNLRRHADRGQPEAASGISVWWATWKRAAVRYTPLTAERQAFLKQLITSKPSTTAVNTQQTFLDGLSYAKSASYQQVFLLIDVVDSGQRHLGNLQQNLEQLWHFLATVTDPPLPIHLKFFLPKQLKPFVEESLMHLDNKLTQACFSAIINWNRPEALQSIIENRFRSAGSWIRGFNTIAGQDIAGQLDQLMIDSAQKSPRRLMQIANLLIDAHVKRDETDPLITAVDWQEMCKMWSYGSPPPAPLVSNKGAAV